MNKPTYEELEAQVKQLAAENAALKSKGRELLGEACLVYAKLNNLIDHEVGDFVDGQTLHEFQLVLDAETPATDAILASLRAEGVEMAASERWGRGYVFDELNEFAAHLRSKSEVQS